MSTVAISAVEWLATVIFVASYFFGRPATMRGLQMLGASLWILYGGLSGSGPVLVANGLVIAAAAITAWRASSRQGAAITAENP